MERRHRGPDGLTDEERAWLAGRDLDEVRLVEAPRPARGPRRRALLAGAVALGAAGGAAALGGSGLSAALDAIPGSPGRRPEPRASCVPVSSLLTTGRIGSATLVYEVDEKPRPMAFDRGFHAQLERWLADWNAHSRHGGVRQVWSQGAHVAKDDCRSWHAAGRAFDIGHLMAGDELLVSCRTDRWDGLPAARRRDLTRRYWALAASLHLHFAYVLTHHFDDLHRNHIHVDNGISGTGPSHFDERSRVQNQAVQAICAVLWDEPGEVTGQWGDAQGQVAPVLHRLGLDDLRRQADWQAFLRASMPRG